MSQTPKDIADTETQRFALAVAAFVAVYVVWFLVNRREDSTQLVLAGARCASSSHR